MSEQTDPLYYGAGLQMAASYLASGRIEDMRAVLQTLVEAAEPVAPVVGERGRALIQALIEVEAERDAWKIRALELGVADSFRREPIATRTPEEER